MEANPGPGGATYRTHLIDLLRGLSALAVVLFHFNEPYPLLGDPYHRLVKYGWMGVAVFFVISGYCIGAARERDRLVPFWCRRLIRIFAPYWASVLLVVAIIAFRYFTFGVNDITAVPRSGVAWLYTFLALTAPASPVPAMNWVYWSLGYELAFYLLVGLFAFRGWPVVAGLIPLVALLVPQFPLDKWCLFGLGVACYYATSGRRQRAAIIGIPCLAGIVLGLGWTEAMAGLVGATLILFPGRWAASAVLRPLRQVGLFSYSLYLVHVPIGCYLLPRYLQFPEPRQPGMAVVHDAVLLVATFAVAGLFYVLIERPSHRLARRIFPRTPPPPGA